MSEWSRRSFLTSSPWLFAPLAVAGGFEARSLAQAGAPPTGPAAEDALPGSFPQQPPTIVQEVVGASHGNFARVKELVDARPALARATWDWAFGDWETALGAASHTGHRDIAEYLIAHGARPTIFSAAMLGQIDVVRAFVAASPGVQRIPGPHGITLLRHAMAGGAPAQDVVDYLTSVEGADDRPALAPLAGDDRDALVGTYAFGPDAADQLEVSVSREQLMLKRSGGTNRGLMHLGALAFFPIGVPDARVRFAREGSSTSVTVTDGPVHVVGRRT
ncbi:MAG: hypothetical protein R2752_02225 [Vicinamibacterales bacterium]